ncbi:MAG: hypothetical protein OEV44_01515 [Spirochaetota bacterium]|nr:hypothetical protein [Spirochaetota bacterium]
MKKIIILIILVFFAVPNYHNGDNLLKQKAIIGFKNINLRDSLSTTIKKINNYGFNYSTKHAKEFKTSINPYLMFSKVFPIGYTSDSLSVKINHETYYITLEDFNIEHQNYKLQPRNKLFTLNFLKLKRLEIINHNHLNQINPYLNNLNLNFFSDQLYQINYNLILNMDLMKRLFTNFNQKFGMHKLEVVKVENIGNLAIVKWNFKDVEIIAKLNKVSYNNLNRLDSIRNESLLFENQSITVTLTQKNIKNEVLKYEYNINKDIIDTIKQEIENRLSKIKKHIIIKFDIFGKKELPRLKTNLLKNYKDIDNL